MALIRPAISNNYRLAEKQDYHPTWPLSEIEISDCRAYRRFLTDRGHRFWDSSSSNLRFRPATASGSPPCCCMFTTVAACSCCRGRVLLFDLLSAISEGSSCFGPTFFIPTSCFLDKISSSSASYKASLGARTACAKADWASSNFWNTALTCCFLFRGEDLILVNPQLCH